MNNNCKICNTNSNFIFNKTLLGKYKINYYKCDVCKFIQTESPYWLQEAYNSAITTLDIGLPYRNWECALHVSRVLKLNFRTNKKFLDYGGGYGLFVRLMRDRGFDFYRQDIYCDNIFANFFDISDIQVNTGFELVTSFEVFEHLENPLLEIEKMLAAGNALFFSTATQPSILRQKIKKENIENWWYILPEIGQHIALYDQETLVYIAKKFNVFFYTDGASLHLFSKKRIIPIYFGYLKLKRLTLSIANLMRRFIKADNRKISLSNDFNYIKDKMYDSKNKM